MHANRWKLSPDNHSHRPFQSELLLQKYIYEQKLNIGKQPTRLNTSLLIFNRNPKAASETIWTLLEKLSKPNQFNCYTDSPEAKKDRGSNRAELAIKD